MKAIFYIFMGLLLAKSLVYCFFFVICVVGSLFDFLTTKKRRKEFFKDIKENGLLYPMLSRIYKGVRLGIFNKRWQHELDVIICLSFAIIINRMFAELESVNKICVVGVLFIRMIYLHIHQMNVLFFDRGIMGKEKNNIKSIPRIVLISACNLAEVVLLLGLNTKLDIVVNVALATTTIQLLASISQLYNFRRI